MSESAGGRGRDIGERCLPASVKRAPESETTGMCLPSRRGVTIRQETTMSKTTQQHLDARRANTLRRILAGRKRVEIGTWKWGHPQTIDTLQRVLPERYLKRALLRFAEFVKMLDEHDDTF